MSEARRMFIITLQTAVYHLQLTGSVSSMDDDIIGSLTIRYNPQSDKQMSLFFEREPENYIVVLTALLSNQLGRLCQFCYG